MRRTLLIAVSMAAGALFALALGGAGGSASATKPAPPPAGPQADSAPFTLNFASEDGTIGDVLYCGVADGAEPFELDVVVSNPPIFDETGTALATSGYETAGWLSVMLQGTEFFSGPYEYPNPGDRTRNPELNVPSNGSFAFDLTLGGRPSEDQLVQVTSMPYGDFWGGGSPMYGYASVLAAAGAVDPFDGDGRTDNYCVTIGAQPDDHGGGLVHAPTITAEYLEGEISTTLPVPDSWVLDADGSDGGVLLGFPH